MNELRRGDTARGIQSGRVNLRGGTYKKLRVTARAAHFTARTSGRAMRTAGSMAMNRIKAALLSDDKKEIRKYMSDEEIKRWDSLTTFQKRKIIRQAEKHADQMVSRTAEINNRPEILAGRMNKLTREKLPYRYEVGFDREEKTSVIRQSMWKQDAVRRDAEKAALNTEPEKTIIKEVIGTQIDGTQAVGIVPEIKPDIQKNMAATSKTGSIITSSNMRTSARTDSTPIQSFTDTLREEMKDVASVGRNSIKGVQGSSVTGQVNKACRLEKKASGESIQGTVFYAENRKAGDRKAAKIQKKYKKAVANENRKRAVAFLGSVLDSVNKNAERSNRIEAQYRAQAISIDRYAEEQKANNISRALLPARLAGKAAIRKAGRKIAEAIMKLIPPFLKHLFAWLLAGMTLIILFIMILSVLFAGGSQERQADLGVWRLTGYCNCYECCGIYAGGPTASGVMPVEGRTVAIHETTMEAYGLQFGDRLMIRNHIYTLEDHGGSEMGGSNGGKCVDIYVEEHNDCYRDDINGYANIYLVSEDGGLSLIGAGSGSDVVAYADQFLGCPYVWGGSSLTEGCDCSHFVWLVLMNCGLYNGEYLTSGEWAYAGTPVPSLAEARAGDIVVYSGHVAIYDGAGMIVEAKGSAWGITHDRNVTCKPIVAIRRFT